MKLWRDGILLHRCTGYGEHGVYYGENPSMSFFFLFFLFWKDDTDTAHSWGIHDDHHEMGCIPLPPNMRDDAELSW